MSPPRVSLPVLLAAAASLAPISGFAQSPGPPASPAAAAAVDYAAQVKPIFEYYCYQCHGNGQHKGGVRLDVKTNAMAHIIPGDTKRSDVYRSVTRSIGASDRMPPVSQEQPEAGGIETIRLWIEQGANWLPPPSARTNLTYAKDIGPVFERNCFKCHGPAVQRAHLRLDSLAAVLKGCENGPVIFPGKSDQGDLILAVAGVGAHNMPPPNSARPPGVAADGAPEPKPLTADEVGLIRAWVAQGAK
jgi:mono/diheme cytochrome c family protein